MTDDKPPPHTPHMRRKDLPEPLPDVLNAVENSVAYQMNAYLFQRAAELQLTPAQKIALVSGVPRVVGAAVDDIALAIVWLEDGNREHLRLKAEMYAKAIREDRDPDE